MLPSLCYRTPQLRLETLTSQQPAACSSKPGQPRHARTACLMAHRFICLPVLVFSTPLKYISYYGDGVTGLGGA